jgi:antitoxin CcdA
MRRGTSQATDKRVAKVRIRGSLLIAARKARIDISAVLERALVDELAEAKRKKWRQENREAIAVYNEHVERHGVFSHGVRIF